jgi:predicted transcriptional regulator
MRGFLIDTPLPSIVVPPTAPTGATQKVRTFLGTREDWIDAATMVEVLHLSLSQVNSAVTNLLKQGEVQKQSIRGRKGQPQMYRRVNR